jgi:hypothetical protein
MTLARNTKLNILDNIRTLPHIISKAPGYTAFLEYPQTSTILRIVKS